MSTDSLMNAPQHHQKIRVLIVDDEGLMRAGLRLMIDGTDGITVVGEAADGIEVPEAVQRLDPDVVLMDIRMPTVSGIEATAALRRAGSRTQVIILTAFDTDAFLRDALMAGAVSFLLKDAAPDLVIQAVHDAAAGQPRFSPKSLSRLVGLATTRSGAAPAPAHARAEKRSPAERDRRIDIDTAHLVTPREWEIGRYVAQGFTNNDIAAALFLSPTTVKTHLANLFAKLHVTNRVQLAIRVLEQNPSLQVQVEQSETQDDRQH